jgi:hypothetical protein
MDHVLGNRHLLRRALAAGMAGGLAEVAWITLYGSAIRPAEVAREIAATIYPAAAHASWASLAGLGIHLALSTALGLAFVFALWGLRRSGPSRRTLWISATAALTGIWAVNFLWILPALNPAFVTLMPHHATIASKLLFALAMAAVLTVPARRPAAQGDRRYLFYRLHLPFQR